MTRNVDILPFQGLHLSESMCSNDLLILLQSTAHVLNLSRILSLSEVHKM